jgi:hypothetical protein
MLHRPPTSSPELLSSYGAWPADDIVALTTPAGALSEVESGVVDDEIAVTNVAALRAMSAVAADRADDASTAVLGATLLMVAAGAISVVSLGSSVSGGVFAALLVVLAAVIITVTRFKLAHELELVGVAQGLRPDDARAQARSLMPRFFRMD